MATLIPALLRSCQKMGVGTLIVEVISAGVGRKLGAFWERDLIVGGSAGRIEPEWSLEWNLLDIVKNDGVFVLRLVVAMVLGGLVGMERQSRGRPAGLRTNILVCLGSAAIIVAFQKLSMEFNVGAESAIRMDPARAAAGVITGIGFLGAGTIVKSSDYVRGLTTAASIWVVSAIGVTVGLGEYDRRVPDTAGSHCPLCPPSVGHSWRYVCFAPSSLEGGPGSAG